MPHAGRVIFLIFLLSPSICAQGKAPKVENVSMVSLLANPSRYNGHWVCVEGFLHVLPGDHALYLSQTDADYEICSNAIWINDDPVRQSKHFLDDRSWHARYVSITGQFVASSSRSGSTFGGRRQRFGGELRKLQSAGTHRKYHDGAMDLVLRERNLTGPPRLPVPDSLLHGPCNLTQAHALLRFQLSDTAIGQLMQTPQKELTNYHMGLGRWMRNGWGLWKGGCLADYLFDTLRVFHPDDMSGLILNSFWCRLHGQPFDVREYLLNLESFYVPNMEPKKRICSLDSSRVAFSRLVTRRGPGGEKKVLIWGTCVGYGHGWLYAEGTGWERADAYPLTPWYPPDIAF